MKLGAFDLLLWSIGAGLYEMALQPLLFPGNEPMSYDIPLYLATMAVVIGCFDLIRFCMTRWAGR